MSVLGGGLSGARHHEDALSVYEAEMAMERRLGASEKTLFAVQTNLASTYMVLKSRGLPDCGNLDAAVSGESSTRRNRAAMSWRDRRRCEALTFTSHRSHGLPRRLRRIE